MTLLVTAALPNSIWWREWPVHAGVGHRCKNASDNLLIYGQKISTPVVRVRCTLQVARWTRSRSHVQTCLGIDGHWLPFYCLLQRSCWLVVPRRTLLVPSLRWGVVRVTWTLTWSPTTFRRQSTNIATVQLDNQPFTFSHSIYCIAYSIISSAIHTVNYSLIWIGLAFARLSCFFSHLLCFQT